MGSSLYLEISDQELERLVSETLSARLISARILTGGLFNTTYLLDICQKPGDISGEISEKEDAEGDSTERVVLRLGPVNRHLLMPFEHRLMEAETEVYALCETNEIPASQVLAVDTSKKLIDRDFMFVRYIPARPLSELSLEPDAMAAVCREIGEATAKFHTIRAPRFGRIVDVREGKGFDSWSEALNHELMEWNKWVFRHPFLRKRNMRRSGGFSGKPLFIWMKSGYRGWYIRISGLAIFSSPPLTVLRVLPPSSMRTEPCGEILISIFLPFAGATAQTASGRDTETNCRWMRRLLSAETSIPF